MAQALPHLQAKILPSCALSDPHPAKLLSQVTERPGLSQAFLFDAVGDSFWPARIPVDESDVKLLGEAIDALEELSGLRERPFIGRDPRDRFSVTAMSEESGMYLVCIHHPEKHSAEAALMEARRQFAPHIPKFVAARKSTE